MNTPKSGFKSLFERSVQLRSIALLTILLLAFTVFASMIWRNLSRLDRVHIYVNYSHRIQETSVNLHRILVDFLSGETGIDRNRLKIFKNQIAKLRKFDNHLSSLTPSRLKLVSKELSDIENTTVNRSAEGKQLLNAFSIMNQLLGTETLARDRLLEEISYETRIELWMAGATLTALFLVAVWYFRVRILSPLNDLKGLLLRLTHEDYSVIATHQIDPLLVPVYTNYNVMVQHLRSLKETNQRNEALLQNRIRAATKAVMDQQVSLAKAEKLATVGEFSAILAHELRNPLAGIIMSCANLRTEVSDADQQQRLDMISSELQRMANLLNSLLRQSKHLPVDPIQFDLSKFILELIEICEYQIPSNISLKTEMTDQLICYLPQSNLRQALLNLVLNAAQAIGDKVGDIRLNARRDQNDLIIEIIDNGPGFSDAALTGGIRPFFTTRADGTGLGLAMVQRFVKEAGGELILQNLKPHGGFVSMTFSGQAV